MSRRRSSWREVAGTPAAVAYRRVERDGVAVLCVRLAGYAENSPDGVGRVRDGLDELAASIDEVLDVTTLDVRGFSNASDDACQILTGVFPGLPCCWITGMWDLQRGLARWDLPASERMAATGEAALARVVGWRRAGGFDLAYDGAGESFRWDGRGLTVTTSRGGALDTVDLWHRNRLVARELHGERPRRVLWPVADPTGVASEALRRGARLVIADGAVVEVDYSRWSVRVAFPDDWAARIADLLPGLRELDLRGTAARELDILRAVAAAPELAALRVEPAALGATARAQLRATRPGLAVR